jgi:hypothetical protein
LKPALNAEKGVLLTSVTLYPQNAFGRIRSLEGNKLGQGCPEVNRSPNSIGHPHASGWCLAGLPFNPEEI